MKKTKHSSLKSSGGTTSLASSRFQDVRTQTSSAFVPFISEDGMRHENIIQIQGDWGDSLYQDHPYSTPFEDFVQELYAEGYEDSIREGRREYGAYFEDVEKQKSLRSVRLSNGLSQGELAEKAGVQQYQISKYESGKDMPNMTTAMRLCKVLGIDPNTLFELMGLIKA